MIGLTLFQVPKNVKPFNVTTKIRYKDIYVQGVSNSSAIIGGIGNSKIYDFS